jgi:hypothetical protein
MNRTLRFVTVVGCLALNGTPPLLLAQTPSASIEQQLRSQYPITIVGNNGVVIKTGSVLVVQQDGITALPSPSEWPCNSYKQSSRIKQSALCVFNYNQAKPSTRLLQVGEKVYVVAIQAKPTEVVFKVQSIVETAGDAPFKAAVSFQFQKGYLDSIKLKEIQDTIGQIFAPDSSSAVQGSDQTQTNQTPVQAVEPAQSSVSPVTLPSIFARAKAPADQLQLNADNSFSLAEGGQTYHGTFVINGNTLELNIRETGIKTTGSIRANNLTDSSGQTWVLREQATASAPAQSILQNQDIIELVKAGFDDATILATIGNSKCQFDTSTNALIKLKQSKVSAAVIKAIVGAPK